MPDEGESPARCTRRRFFATAYPSGSTKNRGSFFRGNVAKHRQQGTPGLWIRKKHAACSAILVKSYVVSYRATSFTLIVILENILVGTDFSLT